MMNEQRFEALYNTHARLLWSYVSRISGNATLADDIVQEAFMRLLRARTEELDETALKPYLYRIATNLMHDYFRERRREQRKQEELNARSSPEKTVEAFAGESEMTRVFGELKTQERELLWLAYVEGYEHAEIAAVLGLNRMSVRVLLYRARGKLAKLLAGEETGG
jgi:RNA polymerase sigma-70 factor, ECF subfamily